MYRHLPGLVSGLHVDGDETAAAVVDQIRKSGATSYAHKADVASEAEVAAMFAKMKQDFGTIDILVNNAGLQRDSAFAATARRVSRRSSNKGTCHSVWR